MFSCCAASTFIKFTARETAWLVIFPKESPEAGQGLSDINVSSETMGVQETPFLTPHNKSLPYAHIYSALRRFLYMWYTHKHTHLWALTIVNRLNHQMQSPVGKVNLPAIKG